MVASTVTNGLARWFPGTKRRGCFPFVRRLAAILLDDQRHCNALTTVAATGKQVDLDGWCAVTQRTKTKKGYGQITCNPLIFLVRRRIELPTFALRIRTSRHFL